MPSLGDNSHASSRSLLDLHPKMQERFTALCLKYKAKFPNNPQPFLTQTYRNERDQNSDYAKGRTAPGPKVTNAPWSESLHNYYPSLAFDVAFKDESGEVDWSTIDFTDMGSLAASCDLEWGAKFHDNPHFQPYNGGKEYRWEDARAGIEPVWGLISP